MARFEKGNEYWKLRTKRGPDKAFSSPTEMREAVYEYFTWAKENPILKQEIVKYKESYETVLVELERPFTIEALTSFLGVSTQYFKTWRFNNKDASEEWLETIEHILDTVRRDKIELGLVGVLNASLVGRIERLSDVVEHSITDIDFSK